MDKNQEYDKAKESLGWSASQGIGTKPKGYGESVF